MSQLAVLEIKNERISNAMLYNKTKILSERQREKYRVHAT
jgi:hypothetical protein